MSQSTDLIFSPGISTSVGLLKPSRKVRSNDLRAMRRTFSRADGAEIGFHWVFTGRGQSNVILSQTDTVINPNRQQAGDQPHNCRCREL
jgi:hypothetical protein